MKCIKSLFKFWKEFVMTARPSNKCFRINVRTFAVIFIPCLLQFPLVSFGQDWHDGINGNFVFLEGAGESSKISIAISNVGDFANELGLESISGGANAFIAISPQSKSVGGNNSEQSGGNSE